MAKIDKKSRDEPDQPEELLISDGTKASFYLRKGYKYRKFAQDFDDLSNKAKWQDHVYEEANRLFIMNECRTVLDIGCGAGFKLLKYFSGCETIGVDREEIVDTLRERYPDRKWLTPPEPDQPMPAADLYICSDVIEHISQPDAFLRQIASSPFRFLILSTPAREILFADGRREFRGPPANRAHYFEWTMGELNKLMRPYFEIIEHSYKYNGEYTQVVVARQKG